jgi:hypothetical protein
LHWEKQAMKTSKEESDLLFRRLLTISAIAGGAMSLVVLGLWALNSLISLWTVAVDATLWAMIVWGLLDLRKRSGNQMPFARAFTYGFQISFFAALFVALTYFMVLRFLAPGFLDQYLDWVGETMRSVITNMSEADRAGLEADLQLTRESTTIMTFTFSKLVNYSLFGGLFSLLAAALLRSRKKRPMMPPRETETEN